MTFAEHLARFNRKERYWLLRDALGDGAVRLSGKFLDKFPKERRPSVNAWWAMDYHLDWIVASIWSAGLERQALGKAEKVIFAAAIKGTQEDVDLLIVEGDRVWLCEAKFSGALSTSQIDRKVERVKELRHLAKLAELPLDFIEVDALPVGRDARRKDKQRKKENPLEIDAHVDFEFLRLVRTDFDRETCRDFEIEPMKI